MKHSSLSELPNVRALGRHTGRDPLTLYWTASGMELLFDGAELWVDFACDYAANEPWVSVELDGAWYARFAPSPGESRVCLFRGMTPGSVKHVRLLKDVQPMQDDPRHCLQITALEYDDGGAFLPLPAPKARLEFVGDSITSGEGAIGAQGEMDWVSAFFSAENHYARMTADALGAEYRLVSQSGWGIVSGWDNDPRHTLAPYYTQVCGVQANAPGARDTYDFAAWPADAVIINLGTNDGNAFHNPAWVGPDGQTFKQHLAPDGSYAPADAARLAQAVCDFLTLIRSKNPDAVLVWCYGMLGTPLLPLLQARRYPVPGRQRRQPRFSADAARDHRGNLRRAPPPRHRRPPRRRRGTDRLFEGEAAPCIILQD